MVIIWTTKMIANLSYLSPYLTPEKHNKNEDLNICKSSLSIILNLLKFAFDIRLSYESERCQSQVM